LPKVDIHLAAFISIIFVVFSKVRSN